MTFVWLPSSHETGRCPIRENCVGKVLQNQRTGTHNGVATNFHLMRNRGTRAHAREFTHPDIPTGGDARKQAGKCTKVRLVIERDLGIHNGVLTDNTAGVDDRAREHQRAWSERRGRRDPRTGMHHTYKIKLRHETPHIFRDNASRQIVAHSQDTTHEAMFLHQRG